MNHEGHPEMLRDVQQEYDDFVAKIRLGIEEDDIEILDEGYGEGEDELEWHITVCAKSPDKEFAAVLEIDICVRTEEQ